MGQVVVGRDDTVFGIRSSGFKFGPVPASSEAVPGRLLPVSPLLMSPDLLGLLSSLKSFRENPTHSKSSPFLSEPPVLICEKDARRLGFLEAFAESSWKPGGFYTYGEGRRRGVGSASAQKCKIAKRKSPKRQGHFKEKKGEFQA